MGDTYTQYLPKIKAFIRKYVMPDDILRPKYEEIKEDTLQYAYLYWLELNQRFPDNTEASKYYLRSINFKIMDYINWFYKQCKKGHTPPTLVYYDAPAFENEEATYWDMNDTFTEPSIEESVGAKSESEFISLLIEELYSSIPVKRKHNRNIREIINYSITSLEDNDLQTLRHSNNVGHKAAKGNVPINKLRRVWQDTKDNFKAMYPEVEEYLRTGDADIIDKLTRRIKYNRATRGANKRDALKETATYKHNINNQRFIEYNLPMDTSDKVIGAIILLKAWEYDVDRFIQSFISGSAEPEFIEACIERGIKEVTTLRYDTRNVGKVNCYVQDTGIAFDLNRSKSKYIWRKTREAYMMNMEEVEEIKNIFSKL